jgi:hypothetical protein
VKDYRIKKAPTEAMDDEEILWAVIEPMWKDLVLDEEEERAMTAALTPGQRGLIAVDWLSKEVYNGGIHQFFTNSTGVLAHEALEGFRMMGAERYAGLLGAVVALFPGGRVSKNQTERLAAVTAMPAKARSRAFEKFDETFYSLMEVDDPIVAYGKRYVEAHYEEFFIDP